MNYKIEEIERSLVAIFDIENYSEKNPKKQAIMVQTFANSLDEQLKDLEKCKPDVFSTGDGAIVSIGRKCQLNESVVEKFMDFTINFTKQMMNDGPSIRTAINYSEKDNAVIIKDSKYFHGQYIQTGETINVAARIIIYCEPGEILLNKTVYNYLRKLELDHKYALYENKPITTKHNLILYTYSYIPTDDESMYNPEKSPIQDFKQYLYIPPIKSDTINFFKKHGLDNELKKIISSSYDSLKSLNQNQNLLSRHDVIDVLMQLKYDPEDTLYVISRNDHDTGFWTQPRKEKYIDYLKSHKDANNGVLNQIRVMVYNESGCDSALKQEDIFFNLLELHNENTFYRFPVSGLLNYYNIRDLLFGATISKKHKFAIISIPDPESFNINYHITTDIGNLINVFGNYKIYDEPMKAIITHDRNYVETLIKEIELIIKNERIKKIEKKEIINFLNK